MQPDRLEALNMDDRGQIILLAALAVCVCLIMLALYMISLEDAEAIEEPWPGREAMENAVWAQDKGLEQVARARGNNTWDLRIDLANDFKNGARRLIDSVYSNMLARGIAFSYEYNDTLATEYATENVETTSAAIGGVLLKKNGNDTRICGCAYDVSGMDGSAQYCISRVVCWG
jgi:hypothetical protein